MLSFKKVDATKGALLPSLLIYAVPLILSTIVQSLFNAVDLAVLANMADSGAVASVGATSTIVHLIINAFIGLSAGTKIILARYIGAKDHEKIKKTVHTSLLLSLILGVFVAIFGGRFAPELLRLVDCPADCFDGAVLYIRIYVSAAPFILLYNYGSSIITAAGDTRRPFYYIVAGGILNAVLNVILCLILPQKVAAVAIATAASQILGALLITIRLFRTKSAVRLVLSEIRWSFEALGKILRFGLPICFTHILFPLANLQMQSAINSYGVAAVAGNSASSTLETLTSAFTSAFSTSAAVFIGQNIGANQLDRAKKSFAHCLWLGALSGFAVGMFFTLTSRFWFSFLLPDDPVAVEYAIIRLRFVLIYWLVGIDNVLNQTVQALGGTTYSALNSIVCVFGLRIVWMNTIYPQNPTFMGVVICFMASWVMMFFTNSSALAFYYHRLKQGKLKKI